MISFDKYNPQLIALRTVMFCFFGASACLLPYMTIHMRQLGITVEQTAIVYSVLPFAQAIGSPIAGVIADKIGNYKPVLCISLIASILTSIALMLIPSSGNPDLIQRIEEESQHMITFWTYLVIRVLFQMSIGICSTVLDATAIFLCEKHDESFGRIRFWGILATGMFSPICGLLVDYLSHGLDEFSTNYSPNFYFFNILVFLTFSSTLMLNIQIASPPENILQKVKPLLSSYSIWLLLIVVLVLGTMWGFVESFLFLYLLDLNAPKFLLGLTLTTGSLISLPFLRSSKWFLNKLGHPNLIALAFLFYLVRFVGYSLIYSPYWCFPFEAMEVFTYHLMWIAATTHCSETAPKDLRATIIGVIGTLHNGIGRATGSMIGGVLISKLDTRRAFRYIGISSGVTSILYLLCHHTYVDKSSAQKENANHENESSGHIVKQTIIDPPFVPSIHQDGSIEIPVCSDRTK